MNALLITQLFVYAHTFPHNPNNTEQDERYEIADLSLVMERSLKVNVDDNSVKAVAGNYDFCATLDSPSKNSPRNIGILESGVSTISRCKQVIDHMKTTTEKCMLNQIPFSLPYCFFLRS